MDGVTRYLSIAYMVFAVAISWVASKTFALLFSTFSPASDLALAGTSIRLSVVIGLAVGLGATFYCWRNLKIVGWTTEVITELMKVTWPEKEETKKSTVVVVSLSIAMAIILAMMDVFWKYTTDLIL